MDIAQATSFLTKHLDKEHGETSPNLGTETADGIEFITYSGESDIFGEGEGLTIGVLTTLDRYNDMDVWVSYMAKTIDGMTIAGAVCCKSHGEFIDLPNEYETRIWVGQGEVPPEVEKSLKEYVASEVARDFATQITMLKIHLSDQIKHLPLEGRKIIAQSLHDFTKEIIV